MTRLICAGWMLGITALAAEPVRSGRATAEWLAESATVPAGQGLRTAVRLVIDPQWHTYWRNPGEAGMPTSAEWKLPDGWTSGEFAHPIPKSFLTGELAGYGHEGSVLFPVEFEAPVGFQGEAILQCTVSWLACHDDACVPGEAELTLRVKAGEPSPTPAAPDIARAFDAKPSAAPDGVRLTVREDGKDVVLSISGNTPIDFSTSTVYAQSPDLLDPKARIGFQKSADSWQARVAKSPYAPVPITGLELLFLPTATQRAFILTQ
jgi:thiol:disulfide interchange protein DsbD